MWVEPSTAQEVLERARAIAARRRPPVPVVVRAAPSLPAVSARQKRHVRRYGTASTQTVDAAARLAARAMGASLDDLRSGSRHSHVTAARAMMCWLLRRSGWAIPAIGHAIGRCTESARGLVRNALARREASEDFRAKSDAAWLALRQPIMDCDRVGAVTLAIGHFGLTEEALKGGARHMGIRPARAVIHWVGRYYLGLSYPALGALFNRDHSSILWAVAQVDAGRYAAERAGVEAALTAAGHRRLREGP